MPVFQKVATAGDRDGRRVKVGDTVEVAEEYYAGGRVHFARGFEFRVDSIGKGSDGHHGFYTSLRCAELKATIPAKYCRKVHHQKERAS